MLNESHITMKSTILRQASASSAAAVQRVVGDDADRLAAKAGQRCHRALAEARLHFEQRILVDDALDHPLHVVDLGAALRQDVKDFRHVGTGTGGHRRFRRRLAMVAGHV
jgi:hypothetical protein